MDAEEILKAITEQVDKALSIRRSDYFTTKEAKVYLGISEDRLYMLMHNREITYSKPSGKCAYFKKQDLDEYLSRNTIPSFASLEAQAADHVINSAV